ncbi:cytochrome b5 isoform A [Panicum miliaceum]|uniref:Cytochrome b5 isoform A n=1 Tax=Panicum miliaceum TaxID=4540 RepID=A0A3L6TN18_PANMI|nr:cytochrome b5 isoform A [Panicum miliaceum]
MPTLTKLYSMKEAALHNTPEDCWVVVDGKIYDVTKYLEDHPGGADVLLEATGKDAKEEFDDAGHSKSVIELMVQMALLKGVAKTNVWKVRVMNFKLGFALNRN